MIGQARLVDVLPEGGTDDEGARPAQREHQSWLSSPQSLEVIHGGVAGHGCSYLFWDSGKQVEICSS